MLINSINSLWMDGVLAMLAGALLGVFYFAGLWWTVQRLGSSQRVALLFLCSMLLRTGVVIVGFYFILGDSWQHLLLGLLGFIFVRVLATRFIVETESSSSLKSKNGYAP